MQDEKIQGTMRMWRSMLVRSRDDLMNEPLRYGQEISDMVHGEDFELICHHADLPFEETKKSFIDLLNKTFKEDV